MIDETERVPSPSPSSSPQEDLLAPPDAVRGRSSRRSGGAAARRAERGGRGAAEAIDEARPLVVHPLVTGAPSTLPPTLVITCGALVHELQAVARANAWGHLHVTAIPAILHNRPERITAAVRAKIRKARERFDRILVLYGDCGTGGDLDRMLMQEGVERIEGPHCYAFFTGLDAFAALEEEEIATFWLTDFLARNFERLVLQGLSADRHPELLAQYFRNYRRIVHLVQIPDAKAVEAAARAAERLGLPLVTVTTGLAPIGTFLGGAGA